MGEEDGSDPSVFFFHLIIIIIIIIIIITKYALDYKTMKVGRLA